MPGSGKLNIFILRSLFPMENFIHIQKWREYYKGHSNIHQHSSLTKKFFQDDLKANPRFMSLHRSTLWFTLLIDKDLKNIYNLRAHNDFQQNHQ